MKKAYQISCSIAVLLVIWEVVSLAQFVPISLFPPPTQVISAFKEMALSGELFRDIQASLWRAIVGFFIGSIGGISVGLLTGRVKVLHNYLSPVIQLFRPLPPVAIIPLVIV